MRIEPFVNPLFIRICQQLDEYFKGLRKEFEIPIVYPQGTPFQQKVWQVLMKIPYGEVLSYQQVAMLIQKPLAVRAVGQAIHRNPIAIVIPCHRVIGKSGLLTGYAAGVGKKEFLLQLEKVL